VNAFSCKRRKQHALKGQKLLAQGNTLGIKQLAGQKTQAARPVKGQKLTAHGNVLGIRQLATRPVRAKALKLQAIF
jgi:hypothetical protein